MLDLILLVAFSPAIRDLGADDFQTRQRAEAFLRRHEYLAWRPCSLPFRDPERRRRAARVASRYLGGDWRPFTELVYGRVAWWYEDNCLRHTCRCDRPMGLEELNKDPEDPWVFLGYSATQEDNGPLLRLHEAWLSLFGESRAWAWDGSREVYPEAVQLRATGWVGELLLRRGVPRSAVARYLMRR